MRRTIAFLVALWLGACVTYREDLNRGQSRYEDNEFEKALAIWRVLEKDVDSLSLNDQARYAYLRGMTDYRLAFREDARHWLGLALAIEQQHPGGLSDIWKGRIAEALEDLNKDVFGGSEGFAADAGTDAATTGDTETTSDAASSEPSDGPKGQHCTISPDCPPDHMCQDSLCVPL